MRKRRATPYVFSQPALFGLAFLLLAALLCDGPDRAAGSDTDWTANDVSSAILGDGQGTDNPDDGVMVFERVFLRKAAARFARKFGGAEQTLSHVGESLLRDARGLPAAYVALFAVGSGQAAEAQEMADRFNRAGARFRAALAEKQMDQALAAVRDLRNDPDFLTVMIGARPDLPKLISFSVGVPPQSFAGLGRERVAGELGVPSSQVQVVRPFYEASMPPGESFGFLYAVPGEGESVPYVYVLPNGLQPLGAVMPAGGFPPMVPAALAAPPAPVTEAYADRLRAWGELAGAVGFGQAGDVCPACSAEVAGHVQAGIPGGLAAGDGGGTTTCSCFKVHDRQMCEREDGEPLVPVSVETCDDFAGECCDYDAVDYTDEGCIEITAGNICYESCECECYETYDHVVEDYGRFIRGVPTFWQFHVDTEGDTNRDGDACESTSAVGCGPVCGAELIAWWDMLGWNLLGDDFRSPSGKLNWVKLTRTLRDDYYGSACTRNGCTVTNVGDRVSGTEQFFEDRGVGYTLDTEKVDASNARAAFLQIKDSIDANRPVMLSYCSKSTHEGGIWRGTDPEDDPDTDGDETKCGGHAALIAGYYGEGSSSYIYVNTGWGEGRNEVYEFDTGYAGAGALYLAHLKPDHDDNEYAGGTGDKWCSADDLGAHLETAPYWEQTLTTSGGDTHTAYGTVSYTAAEMDETSFSIVSPVAGARCDILGGTYTEARDRLASRSDYFCNWGYRIAPWYASCDALQPKDWTIEWVEPLLLDKYVLFDDLYTTLIIRAPQPIPAAEPAP